MWKIKKKYFIFLIGGVSFFILLSLSQRIGTSSQTNIDIIQVGEFFLKIVIIIAFISFWLLYYKIGKRYFVKAPKKINLESWAKYVLVWGLVYPSIYTFIIGPFFVFCGLLSIVPIKDSFTFTIDLFFSGPFYYTLLSTACFVGSNISYFYYGIFQPWWQKE
jgi:uncharacterized membrane protein